MNSSAVKTQVAHQRSSKIKMQPQDQQRQPIRDWVADAAKKIAPVWPLETFIAVNPLRGYEDLPFEQALAQGYGRQRLPYDHPALERVNRCMIQWCSRFFDGGQATVTMPYRDLGFYGAFLQLARYDRHLHQNKAEAKVFLKNLPKSSEQALAQCLLKLGVAPGQEEAFFTQALLDLPGWSGHIKWHCEWKTIDPLQPHPVTMVDFLAIRLIITCLLWPDVFQTHPGIVHPMDLSVPDHLIRQLERHETNYRNELLEQLKPALGDLHATHASSTYVRKTAQWIFCIDVRSEPFRRALESLGDYETFGFAGFFGLPIRARELESQKMKDCCPVLIKPSYQVEQTCLEGQHGRLKRFRQGQKFMHALRRMYLQLKHNFSTPFALVESMGLWYGLTMLFKSIAPFKTYQLNQTVKQWIAPKVPSRIQHQHEMSLSVRIDHADTALRLMGLTSDFAKLVIVCGHGASTENNPYASALDCGACGGNQGVMNAQLLASILNQVDVRHGLEARGIHIPFDTVFYGALHDTTTDELRIETQEHPQGPYPMLLQQLEEDLVKAQTLTQQERARKLEINHPSKDILTRSVDWSETRPEWGLARNAAMIIAPRQLTRSLNLDGRCFLHSYRWEIDHDNALLETLLTAPMVVAQWINTQYLFSTLDNITFGSGSKITHNVVGQMGIMQGNGSDLMHGLPMQSVMSHDDHAYHEPQRLLTLVYAPRAKVTALIDKHAILSQLFVNQWVHLVVIEPHEDQAYQYQPSGTWSKLA